MARGLFSTFSFLTIILASMMALGMAQREQQRQQDPTTCLTRLLPCLNYLNSSRREPPGSCCNPLKSVIKSNPECLCALISTRVTDQARQAGINVDRASELPGKCGQHVNPLGCLKSAGNSASDSATSSLSANGFMVLSLWTAFAWVL
uniref:Bifunctional inhibitor/plant lipid transfer protein/seed storage helical domain-containing protein n=1 Tax=Kalanchoe fedtschenkoi TaxID=63787 RepID=A0A7N0UPF5_KALFE